MNELLASIPRLRSIRKTDKPLLAVLIGLHVTLLCVSLTYIEGFHAKGYAAFLLALGVLIAFSVYSLLFVTSSFTFGYLLCFYFLTVLSGYIWLNNFSFLPYDHTRAALSIFVSAPAFFLPALLIKKPLKQAFCLSEQAFHLLPLVILAFSTLVIVTGATYNFRLASLSDIYRFRATLEFPAWLRYAIGITSGALLPFAFACYVERKSIWGAAVALILLLFLYPITLTKLTLMAPLWLLYLLVLSELFSIRVAVILSLLVPMSFGVVLFFLTKLSHHEPIPIVKVYIGLVNSRMIAMPSMALDVYNHFFSRNPLTHFCQINALKPFLNCPYKEPLSVLMDRTYWYGAFNASLFATEGIASVGPALAPISALGCGLVISLGNRLSAGLPPRFVLLSTGVLLQIFTNVPLSTTLLTDGAALLFLLWYITPRGIHSDRKEVTA